GGGSVTCTTLTVGASSVSGNRAGANVGGLAAVVTTATFTTVTVVGNAAGSNEGGLYFVESTLAMTGCTVSTNRAGLEVAGLCATGTAARTNPAVSGNRAGGSDGGLGFDGAQLTLIGDTIANNVAAANDGGAFVNVTNGGTIRATTVSGNRTAGVAGGLNTN